MTTRNQRSKTLALFATILMVLAVPISLVGLNSVNDIRNRASEETPLLSFSNDFSSAELTSTYRGIPYSQTLNLTGDLSSIATLSLGCDTTICGTSCPTSLHTPPAGLILGNDGKTLYWENPIPEGETQSWPITVTATSPSPEDPSTTICVSDSFVLSYFEERSNQPPTCTLYPPAQPDTIPSGFAAALRLEARDLDGGIAGATVSFSTEGSVVETRTWTLDDLPTTLFLNKDSSPALVFVPQSAGTYTYAAEVTDSSGVTSDCEVYGTAGINVVIPGENGSPVFTSDPYTQSTPGTSLNIGQSYSFTLEANDPDGDSIDYFVVNNTNWLTFTVNDTAPGTFRGTFTGTPTEAGSYTAGIALNDGAHNHYSTQLWVINVNYPENDVPAVTITLPPAGTSISTEETMRIEWEATDRNLIERFDVYLSTDPANQSTFIPLITGLAYNYNAYAWVIGQTPPGYYYIVVHASDNQTPPATGVGISHAFGISVPAQEIPPEQPIVTGHPTITHLAPADRSEIEETDPFISADLTAADLSTIVPESIVITLDDVDVTDLATIEGQDTHDGSFMYRSGPPLGKGSHEVTVSFEDTSGQTATKTWTFTIVETEEEPEEGDDDTLTIFGFKIPRRIAVIVGLGLLLLIIALAIPWLFYAAWKSSRETDDSGYESSYSEVQPVLPSSPPQVLTIEKTTLKDTPTSVSLEPTTNPFEKKPRDPFVPEFSTSTSSTIVTPAPTEPPEVWTQVNPEDGSRRERSSSTDSSTESPIIEAESNPGDTPGSQVDDSSNSPIISTIEESSTVKPTATDPDNGDTSGSPEDEEQSFEKVQKAFHDISREQGFTPEEPVNTGKQPTVDDQPQEPALAVPQKPELSPKDLPKSGRPDDDLPESPRPITPIAK